MTIERMTIRFAIFFLLLGTTLAWSQRHKKPEKPDDGHAAAESKIKPRFSDIHKSPHTYILEDDDQYSSHGHGHKGGDSEEYVDSEDHKSLKEEAEAQGDEHSDKNVKDDEYDDHSKKGGHQEFKAGGATYDKHLKDHKADNKEVENAKGHDVGEKFGGEAVKEHKLGKNKEKSKGHKLHGFKNVYHKEEYGDHKTFHDEFLDSDHQHNYDDQHEHKEMHGGKFSKAFKHEGKNKKYDKGDEKREWGKQEFDANSEGKHESGGQTSKHRHGSKKHQAHFDTNHQRNKNSVHKVKKGSPPPYIPHAGHHGPHQAQIEPYEHHYNHHHQQVHVPSPQYTPHVSGQSHQVHDDDDVHGSYKNHESQYQNHDDQHSSHREHPHDHGGHHDLDHHREYHHNEDNHNNDYQERLGKTNHQHNPVKTQLEDKSGEEKSAEKLEPPAQVGKHEPVAYKHYVPLNYGIQRYRQPVYQEQSRFQRPEYSRQEKFSQPFSEKLHSHNHRFRYGFQPRNHHHQLHHHHQQQHHQFPRFPGFAHHHHAHGHHNHDAHKRHFRHTPSNHEQSFNPDTHARKAEQPFVKPEKSEGHHQISQKRYE